MRGSQMSNGLRLTWVEVRDQRGRTHMEARWVASDAATTPVVTMHAA